MSNFNFIVILFIGFLDYVGISLVYPVFASMLFDSNYPLIHCDASSGYRGAILGILIGLTPFTQFFSAPILGSISDVKGRKKTLMYGTFLGFIAYGLAVIGVCLHSLALLFFYRFLVGICSGTLPVAQAMITDFSSKEQKAKRFSLFNASAGLGFVVGPLLGGKLADPAGFLQGSYFLPFVAAGVMCLISFVVIAWKLPETGKMDPNIPFDIAKSVCNIRKVFLWKKLRWLFLATFLFAFGWSFFNEFIPVFLRERFAFSLSEIGSYYAYGGFLYAVGSGVVMPLLLQYFSPEQLAMKAVIGCASWMGLFLVVTQSMYIWYIMPPLMFCLSCTFPLFAALVSNKAEESNQGEVLGVYQSVTGCAMGLSPLLVGSAIGVYPSLAVLGGSFFMLLAAGAIYRDQIRYAEDLIR